MIFVDASVPIHITGDPHPYKDRAEALIEQLRSDGEEFATDTGGYQEILHRCAFALAPYEADGAFRVLDSIVDEVFTFGMPEIHAAKEMLLQADFGFSARDAIHVAVMRRENITRILSFVRGFDACPGIERIS